jgi:hypothetical protein
VCVWHGCGTNCDVIPALPAPAKAGGPGPMHADVERDGCLYDGLAQLRRVWAPARPNTALARVGKQKRGRGDGGVCGTAAAPTSMSSRRCLPLRKRGAGTHARRCRAGRVCLHDGLAQLRRVWAPARPNTALARVGKLKRGRGDGHIRCTRRASLAPGVESVPLPPPYRLRRSDGIMRASTLSPRTKWW